MVGIIIATPDTGTPIVYSILKTGILPKRAFLTRANRHDWTGTDFTVSKRYQSLKLIIENHAMKYKTVVQYFFTGKSRHFLTVCDQIANDMINFMQ